MINIEELISAIESKNNFPLDPEQKEAIIHVGGPLWIVAGPGTGKTEVLVIKVLKLLCCDEVDPKSIIITTYTQKAALNLENRIAEGMLYIINTHPEIALIDYCQLKIGTLHSLCNDILQEYRYNPYQNIRLMDEIEQAMFIRQYVAKHARENFLRIKDHFFSIMAADPREINSNNLWSWTKFLQTLFNRIIEDDIDILAMKAAGMHWEDLVHAFEFYEQKLLEKHSCDFSHLQKYFYEFLLTPQGEEFLKGTSYVSTTPVRFVLVDEYQDTNPIQENIYFRLASNSPHDICVVGDDDQALFRFRGGTVDCMINFSAQCASRFGVTPVKKYLSKNHRSNEHIVNWCNTFINSFDIMRQPGARIAQKPSLNATSGREDHDKGVSYLTGSKIDDVVNSFAKLVYDLLSNSIIEDYSQCVLILPSTKDSSRNAGKYIAALLAHDIPIYNPRAKSFLENGEVKELLGSFISIIDPQLTSINHEYSHDVFDLVSNWVDSYTRIARTHHELRHYIESSINSISANTDPQKTFAEYAAGVLYRIISFEPFCTYQSSPEKDLRIGKVTRIFESFLSLNGRSLEADPANPQIIKKWWLSRFYSSFCGYLAQFNMNDDDNDEVICPRGYFPLMTVHQSKGLEFDFVFAGNLGRSVSPSSEHELEREFSSFRKTPIVITQTLENLAWQDAIRLHFVTYSRAKNALILLATKGQMQKTGNETAAFSYNGGVWFGSHYPIL